MGFNINFSAMFIHYLKLGDYEKSSVKKQILTNALVAVAADKFEVEIIVALR